MLICQHFNGRVAIGTNNATSPLTVVSGGNDLALFQSSGSNNARITVSNALGSMNIGIGTITPHAYIWSQTNSLFIGNDGNPTIFVNGMYNGNVGIGTTNPGSFKLAVEGKIAARGVKVTLGSFADYVFDSTYQLIPLAHLEQYINQNKHLPGIASEEEVKKDGGVELGEMNVKLLEKVEELSLYIIEMNKKMEQQQIKSELQQMEIERMKKIISNIKK